MLIETEETPNPETLKFVPGEPVTTLAAEEFKDRDAANKSPLAKRLFDIKGVGSVFIAPDFVAVTKNENDWGLLSTQIVNAIRDHYLSGMPAINGAPADDTQSEDNEIVIQIKELLEERVRPAVAADGGDIIFSSFEDGIVYLKLQGACSGCPSSTVTLKAGIENLLKHFIPEVIAVEAVSDFGPE